MTGHTLIGYAFDGDNPLTLLRDLAPQFGTKFLLSYYFAVDTFFTLGAFLSGYMLVEFFKKESSKSATSGSNYFSWSGLVYLHRYLRLTPVYFVCIMFFTYLIPLVAQGPTWSTSTVVCLDDDIK